MDYRLATALRHHLITCDVDKNAVLKKVVSAGNRAVGEFMWRKVFHPGDTPCADLGLDAFERADRSREDHAGSSTVLSV